VIGPQTILTYQTVAETSDGLGGFTEVWTNVGNISGVLTGSRRGLIAKESFKTDKITVESSHTFYCDVLSFSITEKGRFVLGTRSFDILFVYEPGNCGHHKEIDLREVK